MCYLDRDGRSHPIARCSAARCQHDRQADSLRRCTLGQEGAVRVWRGSHARPGSVQEGCAQVAWIPIGCKVLSLDSCMIILSWRIFASEDVVSSLTLIELQIECIMFEGDLVFAHVSLRCEFA